MARNPGKLELDKYYTPDDVAQYCVNKTFEILSDYDITDVVEPSAGGGAFSNLLPGCTALDISPEGPGIIQQDFLLWKERYKHGRLFIGNPPFGDGCDNILTKFYIKATILGDFISWILPINYLNNQGRLHQFKLIYSEDLGDILYSGSHKIRTCLNIYKRPSANEAGNRKIKNYNLRDISITCVDRKRKSGVLSYNKDITKLDYDFKISAFGFPRLLDKDKWLVSNICIKVNNANVYDSVYNALKIIDNNTDEQNKELFRCSGVACVTTYKLIEFLQNKIPELK